MKTVAVSLNRQLEQVIREALLSDSLTQEQKNCLAEDIEKSYVSVRSLSLVQRILADNQKSYSHLLKGSKLLFPKFMEKFSSKESVSIL